MKLSSIVSSVQLICDAIASVVHIDVTIVDSDLVRLAGTGRYKENVGNVVGQRSAFHYALSEGVGFVIENPGEHQACLACDCKDKCSEHAEMCCPIRVEDETVGVIGLIAFEPQQRDLLISGKDDLMAFLNHMADLIASKLKAQESMVEVERMATELQLVVDGIDTGFIAIDSGGKILRANSKAEKLLGKIQLSYLHQLLPYDDCHRILKTGKPLRNISFLLPSGARGVYDVTGIKVQGLSKGFVLTLKPLEEVIKTVNDLTLDDVVTDFSDILGDSKAMADAKNTAMMVASKPSTVLILGESGTGKELFARAIHKNSMRSKGPFIAVNCAAIPDGLLESELFGYEEGAFTGARVGGKPGKFQLASGGTLFLDEIGDMPIHLQVKLLRALQERTIEPIGGKNTIPVDVRVIAATHQDLEAKVLEGSFRADLYYRLNVIPVGIPPLRQRVEDLDALVPRILRKNNETLERQVLGFVSDALDLLKMYPWPGNVRELENCIEYAVSMCEGQWILPKHLPKRLVDTPKGVQSSDTYSIKPLEDLERYAIEGALRHYGKDSSSVEKAAKALGISRATLYRKIKAFNIDVY